MQDFSDFHQAAADMMADFGSNGVLLKRSGDDEYDPATASVQPVIDEIPITCILMDLTLQSNGAGVRDKTLIQEGDKVLYVQPSEELGMELSRIDPAADKVLVGGVTYSVVTTKTLDPSASNTPILFELYVRR